MKYLLAGLMAWGCVVGLEAMTAIATAQDSMPALSDVPAEDYPANYSVEDFELRRGLNDYEPAVSSNEEGSILNLETVADNINTNVTGDVSAQVITVQDTFNPTEPEQRRLLIDTK